MSTRSIYKIELHEEMEVGANLYVTRVPGGWIYKHTSVSINDAWNLSTVFVPFNKEFLQEVNMATRTCKACKWWAVDFVGICDFLNTIHAENAVATKFAVDVDADDDSGVVAYVCTGPDFGCIHFKEKV